MLIGCEGSSSLPLACLLQFSGILSFRPNSWRHCGGGGNRFDGFPPPSSPGKVPASWSGAWRRRYARPPPDSNDTSTSLLHRFLEKCWWRRESPQAVPTAVSVRRYSTEARHAPGGRTRTDIPALLCCHAGSPKSLTTISIGGSHTTSRWVSDAANLSNHGCGSVASARD